VEEREEINFGLARARYLDHDFLDLKSRKPHLLTPRPGFFILTLHSRKRNSNFQI
jgi:hypothetical protein